MTTTHYSFNVYGTTLSQLKQAANQEARRFYDHKNYRLTRFFITKTSPIEGKQYYEASVTADDQDPT